MSRILLLGSGELGKEVVIELKRLGAYVIAADRYEQAPALQVADEQYVLDMTSESALRSVIGRVQPDLIVPEIEAIATSVLAPDVLSSFAPKARVVPSYDAVSLTMNREGIRRLAAEELGLKTSDYRFAESEQELRDCTDMIGYPVVIKPVQSSSGKGQSIAHTAAEIAQSWEISQSEARGGTEGVKRVIVEGFVDFDFEITLLTCKSVSGIVFCEPIGHQQVDGDYRVSWQPQTMSDIALKKSQEMAAKVVNALTEKECNYGIFGVELFIKGDNVIFSEVSPRPHDTGMVTMISQSESEFAMHAKAILGYPVHQPTTTPSASYALLAHGHGRPVIDNVADVLQDSSVQIRIFGKPSVDGERRVGVLLKTADIAQVNSTNAGEIAQNVAQEIEEVAKKLDIRCV